MRFYYDMFVPYMPDAVRNEQGELVRNDQLAAGRQAMIELSKFQTSGEIMCLYQSVLQACIYAGTDLVDTILNIPADMELADGSTISSLLDEAAKSLFASIKVDVTFDINLFVLNVLNVAHALLSTPTNQPEQPEEPQDVEEVPAETEEVKSGHQMSLEELL